MKVTIKRACVHEEVIEVFGKAADREKRIRYEESKVCGECYAAQQAAELGGEWIEMPYGEFKHGYADQPHREYNPTAKTILVLVKNEQ